MNTQSFDEQRRRQQREQERLWDALNQHNQNLRVMLEFTATTNWQQVRRWRRIPFFKKWVQRG